MKAQWFGRAAVLASALFHTVPAVADDADLAVLHCVVATCAPQSSCRAQMELENYGVSLDAGNEFIFLVTDHWTVTPESFRLVNYRFSNEGYMNKTTVNIDANRSTKAFRISVAHTGTGIKTTETKAEGTCDVIKAQPVIF